MAIVYETKTSSGAMTSIVTDSNGLFKFYIDTIDYGVEQLFDVLCAEITYQDINVFKMENAVETPFTPAVSASWDWEIDPPVNVKEALDDLITRDIDGGEF